MKKGISAWAFGTFSAETVFEKARRYGYEGVELTLEESGELSFETAEPQARRIREAAERHGVELYSLACGLYWKYSLTADDPAEREKAEFIARRQLDLAAWLGCDTVLVVPGMVQGLDPSGPTVPYDTVYARAAEALKRLAPHAEERGVTLAVENVWNKFLLSPLEMRDFTDSIGSPRVGVYFDVGNVMAHGVPEDWIRILNRRIAKVHFKDFRRAVGTLEGFTDLLSGDVHYPEVMRALREIGYDGWVTAEVFPRAQDPDAVAVFSSAAMDRILAM